MVEQFICGRCGEIFAEPDIYEHYENHGPGLRERWVEYRCPVCGSDEVDNYSEDDDA